MQDNCCDCDQAVLHSELHASLRTEPCLKQKPESKNAGHSPEPSTREKNQILLFQL